MSDLGERREGEDGHRRKEREREGSNSRLSGNWDDASLM